MTTGIIEVLNRTRKLRCPGIPNPVRDLTAPFAQLDIGEKSRPGTKEINYNYRHRRLCRCVSLV